VLIDLILVPKGAEYQSVMKGLERAVQPVPKVVAIPMGCLSVLRYLQQWQNTVPQMNSAKTVLVMGLCGSLKPAYGVGDAVLYAHGLDQQNNRWQSDRCLTQTLHTRLNLPLVAALTSDRFIATAPEKQTLAHTYDADVIDMEGTAIFSALAPLNLSIATLRVVSDSCQHNLPDLNSAIDANGSLRSFPMTLCFIRQPIAATRLVRGSLKGLHTLQTLTASLFA
jgi:purine-nucleoside phosphorylase